MKKLLILLSLSTLIFAYQKAIIKVDGMTCPLCTMAVKKSLKKVNGVIKVKVKLNTKKATVIYKKEGIEDKLIKAVKKAGYNGKLIQTSKEP